MQAVGNFHSPAQSGWVGLLAHTHFETIDQLSQLAPADGSISFARAKVLNIELFDPSLVGVRVRDAIDGTRLQVSNSSTSTQMHTYISRETLHLTSSSKRYPSSYPHTSTVSTTPNLGNTINLTLQPEAPELFAPRL